MPFHWHLAQINIGRIRAPIDDPIMRDFKAALDEINALAEATPGFVWRLKEDNGNATAVQAFSDPLVIVNMSVWTEIEPLKNYAYRSAHGKFFARRREWFQEFDGAHLALWWVAAGTLPTVDDAKRRLATLERSGPTAEAFTFKAPFPPP